MKAIITKLDKFPSKKSGDIWVSIHYLTEDGSVGTSMIRESDLDERGSSFEAIEKETLLKDEISQLFDKFTSLDVEFNQQGRLFRVGSE